MYLPNRGMRRRGRHHLPDGISQQTWSGFSPTTVPDNNRQSGFSPTTVPKLSTGMVCDTYDNAVPSSPKLFRITQVYIIWDHTFRTVDLEHIIVCYLGHDILLSVCDVTYNNVDPHQILQDNVSPQHTGSCTVCTVCIALNGLCYAKGSLMA